MTKKKVASKKIAKRDGASVDCFAIHREVMAKDNGASKWAGNVLRTLEKRDAQQRERERIRTRHLRIFL